MSGRRERFRAMLRRLDPIASTEEAPAAGWVVPPPQSFVEELGRALELNQRQNYVLMGGVGSGKTTDLLRLQQALSEDTERLTLFVDVSKHADPTSMVPGALLAVVGLALCDALDPTGESREVRQFRPKFDAQLYGNWDAPFEYDPPDDGPWIPGLAERPSLRRTLGEHAHTLNECLRSCGASRKSLLLLIDGLDRLRSLDPLEAVLQHDLNALLALEALEVSTLVVAPLTLYLGSNLALRGNFDREFLQPYRAPDNDTTRRWFEDILAARGLTERVSPECLGSIVQLSGGVLRDLIMLARMVIEEVYVSGAEMAAPEHVQRAAETFGRKLILGAGKDQLRALQRLRERGVFELITEEDVDLVLHRRVLFYEQNRYAVHPMIVPILARLAGDSSG